MSSSLAIESVKQYLERVWDASPQPDTAVTLFRGQLNSHPLLPRLFRSPNTAKAVRENEKLMLQHLKSQTLHLRPSTPENEWDWISLGQHYGMSTRMSDWSASPLVALFFAVELDPVAEARPLVFCYPVQTSYVVDPQDTANDPPLEIKHTRVIKAGHHSHRSEAQAAWQVVHAIHEDADGTHRFIPLSQMPPHDTRITEIGISPSQVPAIRAELSCWGIKHSTIYGDFGWVCRSIAPSFGLS